MLRVVGDRRSVPSRKKRESRIFLPTLYDDAEFPKYKFPIPLKDVTKLEFLNVSINVYSIEGQKTLNVLPDYDTTR